MKYVLTLLSLLLTVPFFFSIAMAAPQVTISAGAGSMSGAMNVAAAKGFFKGEGVDAKVVSYRKGKVAFDKFLAGEDDFATCNLVGIVLTDFDIAKYRLIGTLSYSDNNIKVLAKKSAGVTRIPDLKGKRIATVRATSAHFHLFKLLALNGIAKDDVEVMYMSKKKLPGAIASGQVDAICQHGIPIQNAKKELQGDWVQFQDSSVDRISIQLVASQKMLEKNGELVKGLLRGTLRGDSFIQTNTGEAVKIIAKDKKYPLELMDKTVREEAEFNLSLKPSLLTQLKAIEQWALENKLVKRTTPRNYLEFIDYKPLESVAPERVTLIR